MEWIESVRKAIEYMEENLTDDLDIAKIARHVLMSPFYFQKGFSMLCGFTVSDYIRQRRLALAGAELSFGKVRVIDAALKYGYESPDSFAKAFTRFHGVTPSAARKGGAMLKTFAPLKISFSLKGGFMMDCKIAEKESFQVVGMSRKFSYGHAETEVPKFWTEFLNSGKYGAVCGMYGINIDASMDNKEFEYVIADDYAADSEVPDGMVTKTIPRFTWAVFPCAGAMPQAMQEVNRMIYSEWLPNCREYEIAAGYCIEMYADPSKFKNGLQDEHYYTEIWIPIKLK